MNNDGDTQAILSRLEDGKDAHAFVQYAITAWALRESRLDIMAYAEHELRHQLTRLLVDLLPTPRDIGPQGTVPLAIQLVRHEAGGPHDDFETRRDPSESARLRGFDAMREHVTLIRYDLFLRRWDDAAARRETAKAVRALVRAEASGTPVPQGTCAFCAGPLPGRCYKVPRLTALHTLTHDFSPDATLEGAFPWDHVVNVCGPECAEALHESWDLDRAAEQSYGRRGN